MYELKTYRELCVMIMKNDAKFEIELTCQFKIDMRHLTNFHSSARKCQKLHLNGMTLTKVYKSQSAEEICFVSLKIDSKFEGKLTCAPKN